MTAALLIFACCVIAVPKYCYSPFDAPKHCLAVIGGVVSLILMGTGTMVNVNTNMLIACGVYAGWIVSCGAAGIGQSNWIRDTARQLSVMLMCLLAVNFEHTMDLILAAAVLNCFAVLMQEKTLFCIPKLLKNKTIDGFMKTNKVGLTGNSNMVGCFLAPCVMLAMHRDMWMLAAVLAVFVYLSECKAAMLATFVGSMFYAGMVGCIELLMVSVFVLTVAVVLKAKDFMGSSMKERMKYWQVALRQIKQAPLFGIGPDCFKINVPFIQEDLNDEGDGTWMKEVNYKRPWPRQAHNDFLQMCCDGGIPAGLAYLAFGVAGVVLNIGAPGLAAAMITLMVCGLMFHPMKVIPSMAVFWLIIFTGACGTPVTMGYWPLLLAVITLPVLWRHAISPLISDMYLRHHYNTIKEDSLIKAGQYDRWNNQVNWAKSQFYAMQGDAEFSYLSAVSALIGYDGNHKMWELLNRLADMTEVFGGDNCAKILSRRALRLYKYLPTAQRRMEDG